MRKILFLAIFVVSAQMLSAQAADGTDLTLFGHGGICMDANGKVNYPTLPNPYGGADLYITPGGLGKWASFGIGMYGGQYYKFKLRPGGDIIGDSTVIKTVHAPVYSFMAAFCLPSSNKRLARFAGPMLPFRFGLMYPDGFRNGACHMWSLGMQFNVNCNMSSKVMRIGFHTGASYNFGNAPGQKSGSAFTVNFEIGASMTFLDLADN